MNKFIDVERIRIAYYEENPSVSPTLIFIHGNSCSSRLWKNQFDDKLLRQFRLIAIDFPGHGKSSPANDPLNDYSPIRTAEILSVAVKRVAGANPFILIGFSYGTNVVAEMLQYDLQPKGIVFIGSCVIGANHPLEKVFIPRDQPSIYFYNEMKKEIVSNFLHDQISRAAESDIQNCIEDYLITDPQFKPALFKAAADGKVSDEIKILQTSNISVCAIFGEEDKLVNTKYLDDAPFSLWQNKIFKMPDGGHWAMMEQPQLFNQLSSAYINEMFTPVRV